MLTITVNNLLYLLSVFCGVIVALSVYIVLSIEGRVKRLEQRCDDQHRKK